MTQLLLRLFVKDYRNTEDPAVRTRYGKLAGIVGIVCNVLLSAGKLLAGTLSGAVSITVPLSSFDVYLAGDVRILRCYG